LTPLVQLLPCAAVQQSGFPTMAQRLHLVFGGELVSPQKNVFKDVSKIHIVGIFPNYETAFLAWKAEAQRTVDNAHMRYFIANIHSLREAGKPDSGTELMDA
jgi:hypothetical protein